MVFLKLWGLVNERSMIVESLHDLGVLHLQDEPGEALSPESAGELKILRGKALGLLEALGWDEWNTIPKKNLEEKRAILSEPDETIIEGIRESLDAFSMRLTEQVALKSELEGRISSVRSALRTLYHFQNFITEYSTKGMDVTLWWVQRVSVPDLVSRIQKQISEKDPLGGDSKTPYHSSVSPGGETIVAIAAHPDHVRIVMEIMSASDCLPWLLPGEYEGVPYRQGIPLMEQAVGDFPRRIGEIDATLKRTKLEWGPKIGALFVLLDEKVEEILVETASETRGEIFRLEGWVPLDEKERVSDFIKSRFGDRVLVKWRDPSPEEWADVPTSLKNPPYFRPFELFLKLMPVLGYKGLDPTILIGIFFPFFGGCMIGDIGYGIIIALLGSWLKKMKHRPLVSDIGSILLFVAAWSIFWGAAYGEVFGDIGHRLLHLEPLWLERSQVVIPVMIFTVSLGFAHVLLGYLMGFVQGIRAKHRHLWLERLGNIFVLGALLSAMILVKGWLPGKFFSIAVSFLILGLALLLAGGGMGGLVEAFGSVGNILSYVRIAAIGLSSAILAMVANSFVDSMGVTFIGIFMALTIHLLNFVLAVAGSSLHSARLQYVEFLGKFHSGGGTQYKPFSRRKPELWKKR